MQFGFVEAGDAGAELIITAASGDALVGKIGGASDDTAIATGAAGFLTNTGLTNAKGDFCRLVAIDATTWVMVAAGGTWAVVT